MDTERGLLVLAESLVEKCLTRYALTGKVVATIANTLGGMTSYGIGRVIPNKAEGRALAWFQRYGEWALLLSWVPLIGDAMCVAAGWLRINPWLALLMMALGKFARYLAIAGGWLWLAAT